MKKRTLPTLFAACAVLALAWTALLSGPALADALHTSVPGGRVHLDGAPKVGQPVKVVFDLNGYRFPAGAYTAVNLEFPNRPEGDKPKVRPGYPETTVTFAVPGEYTVIILLNEVSKSSCGGVKAKPLIDAVLDLHVTP
ncbi:hypothetical protein [Pseudodesulfovibrio mercurii]|nr:hypothetical protein [Pseudodesulfovibrio mercurii]